MSPRNLLLLSALLALAAAAWFVARGVEGGRSERVRTSETLDASRAPVAAETAALSAGSPSAQPSRVDAAAGTNDAGTPSAARVTDARKCSVIVEREGARGVRVEGAQVNVSWNLTADGSMGRTLGGSADAQGAFVFEAPANSTLVVRAEREIDGVLWRGSGSFLTADSSSTPLRVQISPAPPRTIDLLVLDRDSLVPIAGAEVRAPSIGAEARTDATGRCTLAVTDRHASSLGVVVRADAHFPAFQGMNLPATGPFGTARRLGGASPAVAPAGTEGLELVVLLCPAARIEGYVLDPGGAPLLNTEVRAVMRSNAPAWSRDTQVPSPAALRTQTDERGGFTLDCVPAGRVLDLVARSRGESVQCDTEPLTLERGETRTVVMYVSTHVELSGRVFDLDDRPVTGGRIRIDVAGAQDEGSIRADGTYYLPFAVAGAGWISVTREGETEEQRHPVTIPGHVKEWKLDLHLAATTTIAGRFLDEEDRPLQGHLELSQPDAPSIRTGVRGPDGAFEFASVRPGEYLLTGITSELRPSRARGRPDLRNERVSVPRQVLAGDRNVIVRLPACGNLQGRAVDANGRPLAGLLVLVQRERGDRVRAETGPDGTFESRVDVGRARAWVEGSGSRSCPLDVTVATGANTSLGDVQVVPCGELQLVTGLEPTEVRCAVRTDSATWFDGRLQSRASTSVFAPLGRAHVVVLDAAGRVIRETEVEVPERGARFVPVRSRP